MKTLNDPKYLARIRASVLPHRETAIALYQDILVMQNESQGDDFFRLQEVCYAFEDALVANGFLPGRGPCFPAF